MSGYPALLGAPSIALPAKRRPLGQQDSQALTYAYANTAKTVREAEDRILRSMVFAPLIFPFSAPALLFTASLEVTTAALLDTALLPTTLRKNR